MEPITGSIMQLITDTVVFYAALSLVGLLFGALLVLLAWIGSRLHSRLDEISRSLGAIEKDLRNDLTSLDRRLSKMEGHIESKC